jgi:glyoxylase-like metal-dependent hydrolase (beta-lactamase superfamily II)
MRSTIIGRFTCILTLFMLLGIASCDQESPTDEASSSPNGEVNALTNGEAPGLPNYEVYVLMSASWSGLDRFVTLFNDDIIEKSKEEQPITFAYIKGPDVEMVFGPGPRAETVFSLISKGSFDFVDQQTLLARIGADASKIETVVIETTCFDHAGGIDAFPDATFVIQEAEFDAIPTTYSNAVDNEKIKQLKKEGRLEIIDGEEELAPGITAYFMGGHTHGSQFLSVNTVDGLVVLAGDGLYTYENLEHDVESPYRQGNQKAAYERIRAVLGESDELLVPGHDMEVFRRFPEVADRVVQVKLQ